MMLTVKVKKVRYSAVEERIMSVGLVLDFFGISKLFLSILVISIEYTIFIYFLQEWKTSIHTFYTQNTHGVELVKIHNDIMK